MIGTFSKQTIININDSIKWVTDDSNNTIRAECEGYTGNLIQASDVISAMPAFGTFSTKAQVIQSWYKEAAKLSLEITDEQIEI